MVLWSLLADSFGNWLTSSVLLVGFNLLVNEFLIDFLSNFLTTSLLEHLQSGCSFDVLFAWTPSSSTWCAGTSMSNRSFALISLIVLLSSRSHLHFRNIVALVVNLVPPIFTFLSIFLSDSFQQEKVKELSPCEVALLSALG